jgi:hypothetical protein
MDFAFLRSNRFLVAATVALLLTSLFFAWELNRLSFLGFPGPPRFSPTPREQFIAFLIAFLFSINIGLVVWHQKYGTCPRGTKRTTGFAGAVGVTALLCPVCVVVPLGIAGLSLSLAFLVPFIPLLQVVALVLLCASLWMLLPRTAQRV